ncbi:4546_t:CDS:2, partial [Racocetra persica]
IYQVTPHGEAASADYATIVRARSNTGNMTFSGRKKNKERLSIALCANTDGSHKLNPLVIGKYAKPRYFKNINIRNLPMKFYNNTKTWMLAVYFQNWLKDFDTQMAKKI